MRIEIEPHCNEVHKIVISDHPAASRGVKKVVGHCGKTGNVLFIRQHGLELPEMEQVFQYVKEWQQRGV